MGLIDWLCAVGGKLKIIQVTPPEVGQEPEKISTRTILLKDLVSEIQADEVRSLAQQPQDVFDGFERVFQAAGIQPPGHGWTIEKLRDLLRTDPYRSMDRPAVQKALLERLHAEKTPIEDLITDAMARDKALDAFEETARQKMGHRDQARNLKIAELQAQIESLRKQCSDLEQERNVEAAQWRQWHGKKVDFEKEMAWAIGYLMDRPVVSVDTDPT